MVGKQGTTIAVLEITYQAALLHHRELWLLGLGFLGGSCDPVINLI